MTTFGFEAEFTSGAERLIQLLTERGHASQTEDRLHSYHCDCMSCHDLHGVTFRAQRDSSCPGGGEIISGIFTDDDWDTATRAMHALQEAALDVDASIDTNCGMHVHLGADDPDDLAPPAHLAMAWLGVEPLLWEHVATAAWGQRRGTQNHLLSQVMVDMMQNTRIWDRAGQYPCAERDLGLMPLELRVAYVSEFRRVLTTMGWDRHCDLARASHGGAYEMRIFNATRVAWRIELACRLSVALSAPEVAEHFATSTERWLFGQESQLSNRMVALRNGYRRTGRQYTSLQERPLSASLPVSMDDFMATLTDYDDVLGELLLKQTGYVAARKQVGAMRGAISNALDPVLWRHSDVLERLNPRSVDA